MNQFRKDAIILKIRKSSLIVGILCIVSGGINIFAAIANAFTIPDARSSISQKYMISDSIGCGIRALIMLLAAVLFFSMFRSGRPFTPKKIRMVLLIAAVLFVRSVFSSFMYISTLDMEIDKAAAIFALRGGWMESVLFLFAALIMYYASFLQQESDETL